MAAEVRACPRDGKAGGWTGKQKGREFTRPFKTIATAPMSNRSHLDHFRYIVPEHVLDAHFQGRGRGRAAGARALHVEIYDTVFEGMEDDVAAILRDRG